MAGKGDIPVAISIPGILAVVWVVLCFQELCFADENHPVGECIGYTWDHLPGVDKDELVRKAEAIVAIFAARIAFSSFRIRS